MQQTMMLIVLLLAILVASCRSQVCSGNQRQAVFKKLLHLDDVVLKRDDHVMSQAWVTSKTDCSRRCVGTEGCAMFTFQPGQEHASPGGSCQLYDQLPSATMDREASLGARSYAKYADNPDPLQCACDYSRLCGRCLTYVPTHMNFTDARQHCHDLNSGRLMVVRSREELDCVSDMILNSTGWSYVWVGASDMAEEGRYVWEDGTHLPNGSSLWASGAPYDFHGQANCVYLLMGYNGLRNAYCDDPHLDVMCERDN